MTQLSSPCSGDLLELISLRQHPLAQWNDGTTAVYYRKPLTAVQDTKKLLIFLQGGGMCAPSIEGEQLSRREHIWRWGQVSSARSDVITTIPVHGCHRTSARATRSHVPPGQPRLPRLQLWLVESERLEGLMSFKSNVWRVSCLTILTSNKSHVSLPTMRTQQMRINLWII